MCAELLYGLQEVELFLVQAHLLLRVQVIHRGFSVSSSVTSPELSSRGTNNWLGHQRFSRYCCGSVLISLSHITDVSTQWKSLSLSKWISLDLPPFGFRIL